MSMNRLCIYILVCAVAALSTTAMAQMQNAEPQARTLLDNPIKTTFSLLDPQRIKVSHAYSFSYISGSGYSGSVGIYQSTIQYQIAKPLTLRVGLAYAHNPSTLFGQEVGGLTQEGLYPSFRLDYRPSSKLHLGIGFQRVPYNPYYAPYYTPYFERAGIIR